MCHILLPNNSACVCDISEGYIKPHQGLVKLKIHTPNPIVPLQQQSLQEEHLVWKYCKPQNWSQGFLGAFPVHTGSEKGGAEKVLNEG